MRGGIVNINLHGNYFLPRSWRSRKYFAISCKQVVIVRHLAYTTALTFGLGYVFIISVIAVIILNLNFPPTTFVQDLIRNKSIISEQS